MGYNAIFMKFKDSKTNPCYYMSGKSFPLGEGSDQKGPKDVLGAGYHLN